MFSSYIVSIGSAEKEVLVMVMVPSWYGFGSSTSSRAVLPKGSAEVLLIGSVVLVRVSDELIVCSLVSVNSTGRTGLSFLRGAVLFSFC